MMTSSTNAQNYPRPDFERIDLNWTSLNGLWGFLLDDYDVGISEQWHKNGLPASTKDHKKCEINVPFVFQTPASRINNRDAHEVIWYERTIIDIRTEEEIKDQCRLLLRFGAVDYEATVWVDGYYIGFHRGGHVPFDLDITDALHALHENGSPNARLTVRVYDPAYDLTLPRGKQYWQAQPESIWYTPSSGIWQSVWLENLPRTRIADSSHGTILRSNGIEKGELHAKISTIGRRAGQELSIEIEASLGGVPVGKTTREALSRETNYVDINVGLRLSQEQLQDLPKEFLNIVPQDNTSCWLSGLAMWSPEHPALYDLIIRLYNSLGEVIDEVKTTTGMRSIDWKTGDGAFRLNRKPYFQALVLDQGYWPESGMTPPKSSSLKQDIEMAKKMGFNGCRKHQKVEDPLFLYWADKLGYLVWGEMANAYRFSDEYVERFDKEWMESVRRDINHPCVVAWTPVNESWGYPSLKDNIEQRNHIRSLYYMTKTLDHSRPINDNCGWEHVLTDLTTFHDYTESSALTKTCASIEGILDKKSNNNVFVDAIPGDKGCKHVPGAPIICTEFGGINIAPVKGEKAASEKDWGYVTASDPKDLLQRIEDLILGIVKGGMCCGYVYTQLTDIEQEVNGLYSFDRREKLDSAAVRRINEAAINLYYEQLEKI